MKFQTLKIMALTAIIAATSTIALAFDGEGGKEGRHHEMGSGKGFNRMMDKLKEMDANKDGFIDKDEFMKNAEKRWAKLDKEGKGKVSLKEFEEKHKERMKERMERMKEHSDGGGNPSDKETPKE